VQPRRQPAAVATGGRAHVPAGTPEALSTAPIATATASAAAIAAAIAAPTIAAPAASAASATSAAGEHRLCSLIAPGSHVACDP